MVVGLNMFYLLVNGSLGWPLFTIYTALSKSSIKDKKTMIKTKTKIKTNVAPWFTLSALVRNMNVELNKVNPRLNWITLMFLDIEGLQIIIACFCLFCINSGHVLQHIKTGDFDFLLVGVGFKVGGNKN